MSDFHSGRPRRRTAAIATKQHQVPIEEEKAKRARVSDSRPPIGPSDPLILPEPEIQRILRELGLPIGFGSTKNRHLPGNSTRYCHYLKVHKKMHIKKRRAKPSKKNRGKADEQNRKE